MIGRMAGVLCLLLATVLPARAQQDLTREQVAAYVALTKADRAREKGETGAAIAAYEEALGKYATIKKQDPRWHPDVVQYRLAYCANELEKLKRAVAPPPVAKPEPVVEKEPPPPPAPDPELPALRARVQDLESTLGATQAWVKAMADQLATERISLAEHVATTVKATSTATTERDEARAKVKALEKELSHREEVALKGAAATSNQVESLVAEVAKGKEKTKQLSAQLEEAQQAQRALLETLAQATGEVAALTVRLADLTAKRDEAVADRQKMEEEKRLAAQRAEQDQASFQNKAQEELAGSQKDLEQTHQRLATAQEELAALKLSTASTQELAQLSELCETRLQALKAEEQTRTGLENDLKEIRQTLQSTQKALEMALAEKLALEAWRALSRPPPPSATKTVAAPDQDIARLEAQNKALRETLALQEKDMGRVREFKRKVSELEDEISALKKDR